MGAEKEALEETSKLLALPQCVLRILFSYLDATSLYTLSKTCSYLNDFIEDPIFWKYIDARKTPNLQGKLEYCTKKIHEKTTHIFFRGHCGWALIPPYFFEKVCPFTNLKILALENQNFSGSYVSLKDFPSCLEELSLKRTFVKKSVYFFQHSVDNMRKLRVLILDECKWVTCSFLLSVSKYENLEIISIIKCLKIHLSMIPYLNVARYGCKNLKVLDCRFTGIGGEVLRTFYSKKSLQRLYFHSFKAGEVDYNKKIINTDGRLEYKPVYSSECSDLTIGDSNISEYLQTVASNEVEKITDSVLYQDPYPKCDCGQRNSEEPSVVSVLPEDNYLGRRRTFPKFVCRKHSEEAGNLPPDFRDFFFSQIEKDTNSDVDSDSNSSDSDNSNNCCIFGMGKDAPSGHDRTPSSREEMTLPGEGAQNGVPFNIFILKTLGNRDGPNDNDRVHDPNQPSTSRNATSNLNSNNENKTSTRQANKRCAQTDDSGSNKNKKNTRKVVDIRRRAQSDNDSDPGPSKKRKVVGRSELDGPSNEAPAQRVNEFVVDSNDPMTFRINRDENGLITCTTTRIFLQPNSENDTNANSKGAKKKVRKSHNSNTIQEPAPSCSQTRRYILIDNSIDQSASPVHPEDGGQASSSTNYNDPPRIMRDTGIRFSFTGEPGRIMICPDVNNHQPGIQNRALQKKISLKRLSLRGYMRVTDMSLVYLRNLDLELLDVTYTKVTKQGIEDFLVHNPNCRIIHPQYCICKPLIPS